MIHTLAQLKRGESAVIDSFSDREVSLKLLEMGCLPGEEISVDTIAPLGDPIAISINGFILSMRLAEASSVIVKPLHTK